MACGTERGAMDKKTEILEAAGALFAEKGYQLAMSDLADAVGLKPPSLYSHFGSKDAIIEQAVRREIDACFDHYDRALAEQNGRSGRARFEGVFMALVDYFRQDGKLRFWRSISLIPPDSLRDTCVRLIQVREATTGRAIRQWIETGMAAGDLRPLNSEDAALLFFALFQGLLDMLLLYRSSADGTTVLAGRVFSAWWEAVSTEANMQSERGQNHD